MTHAAAITEARNDTLPVLARVRFRPENCDKTPARKKTGEYPYIARHFEKMLPVFVYAKSQRLPSVRVKSKKMELLAEI